MRNDDDERSTSLLPSFIFAVTISSTYLNFLMILSSLSNITIDLETCKGRVRTETRR